MTRLAALKIRIVRFLSAGLTAAAVFYTVGAGPTVQARPLDEVIKTNTLRIIVYRDNRPFSWVENGEVKGIDVEIARGFSKRIGAEPEIIARMTGENVDADLRFNIWRGPYSEGGIGDVMMHVPVDRELMARNNLAVISNAYFQERVSLAIDTDQIKQVPDFGVFKTLKVGVQYGTVADYFLLRFDDGGIINNVAHHTKLEKGVAEFMAKETAALLGVRSDIEGVLHQLGAKVTFVDPPMPGLVRKSWLIGTAVKEDSRDLGYAIGNAIEEMRATGELDTICAKFGVTYVPPQTN